MCQRLWLKNRGTTCCETCCCAFLIILTANIILVNRYVKFPKEIPTSIAESDQTRFPQFHQIDNLTIDKEQIIYNNITLKSIINLGVGTAKQKICEYNNPSIGIGLRTNDISVWSNLKFQVHRKDGSVKQWFGNKFIPSKYVNKKSKIEREYHSSYITIDATGNTGTFYLQVIQLHRLLNSFWITYFVFLELFSITFMLRSAIHEKIRILKDGIYSTYNKTKSLKYFSLLRYVADVLMIGFDFNYLYAFEHVNTFTVTLLYVIYSFTLAMFIGQNYADYQYQRVENTSKSDKGKKSKTYSVMEDRVKDRELNRTRKQLKAVLCDAITVNIIFYESLQLTYKWPLFMFFYPFLIIATQSYSYGKLLGKYCHNKKDSWILILLIVSFIVSFNYNLKSFFVFKQPIQKQFQNCHCTQLFGWKSYAILGLYFSYTLYLIWKLKQYLDRKNGKGGSDSDLERQSNEPDYELSEKEKADSVNSDLKEQLLHEEENKL